MSTIPEQRVHHSDTVRCTLRHTEIPDGAPMCISVCRNGGHDVLQRWTRCAGTVDTVCRNGGHDVLQRSTRCAGTVDTVCRNGGHGVV
ncbi:hypothetical protein [Kibdelosporangium philippinense]|uniref:hypothetical protein n=1 Tax=Kibdelosporangium philippinense TaxID=211113 RepID=UPI003608A7A4